MTEEWMAPGIAIRADGSGVFRGGIPENDLPFFAAFFLGVGSEARVSKPAALLREMESMWRALQAQYRWL